MSILELFAIAVLGSWLFKSWYRMWVLPRTQATAPEPEPEPEPIPTGVRLIVARCLDARGEEVLRSTFPEARGFPLGTISFSGDEGARVFKRTDWQCDLAGETVVIFEEEV